MVESSPTSSSASLPRNVRVLGGTSLLNDIASEMVYPLLPTFLITFLGGNKLHLGIIEGAAESVSSILKLFAGGWSDRAGKRKGVVIVGYTLAVFTRPIIGLLTLPWQLFAARIGDRIGKGIRTAPRDALIADSTDPAMRGRAFGFHRAMDHLGAAIGPLLATAFLFFFPGELPVLFLLTLVPGLLVLGLLLFGLKEPKTITPSKAPLRLTLEPFDRNFRIYLLALVVFTLGNASDSFLLVRAGELGVPIVWLPVLWTVFHIAKSSGNWFAGIAVDQIGPRPMIFVGWFVYALVYLGFAFATTAFDAWMLFLAYAVFYALTEPAEKTLVTNLVGAERKGLAFGWFNFAIGIAALPASLLFGFLYEYFNAVVAFGCSAGLAMAAVLLLAAVGRAKK